MKKKKKKLKKNKKPKNKNRVIQNRKKKSKKSKYKKKSLKKFKKRKHKKISRKKLKKNKKYSSSVNKNSKLIILKIVRLSDKLKLKLSFNFSVDQYLQSFFQTISDNIKSKIQGVKDILEEERQKNKQEKIKKMQTMWSRVQRNKQ